MEKTGIPRLRLDAVPRVTIVPNMVVLSSDECERGMNRRFVGGGMPQAPVIGKVFVMHPEHMVAEVVTPPDHKTADLVVLHRLWSPSASIRVKTAASLARVGDRTRIQT